MSPEQQDHRAHVDVLIASWRRPALLERALASVEKVREARKETLCLHVHVIDEEGGSAEGPAAARNLAAARGQAEYIALLDDDDEWTTERLLRSVELLRCDPELVLVCGDMSQSGSRSLKGRVSIPPDGVTLKHRELTLDCFVCTSTVTLRRRDWELANGMNETLQRAEDYDLWLRLTAEGRTIRVLPELLGHYGEQGQRLSDDRVAMVRATREVLSSSARLGSDRTILNRLGRLDAVIAHDLARSGRSNEARAMALKALREAPTAPIAWSALGRALAPTRG